MRIWVGKTGKDGLKRRCLEYLKEPEKVGTERLVEQYHCENIALISTLASVNKVRK